MNLQEVFNKVWERSKIHVKSMNLESEDNSCFYRNPDGSKNHCFVGICIPDELYDPVIEDGGIQDILDPENKYRYDAKIATIFEGIDPNLLGRLQYIHDNRSCKEWETELRHFARMNGLIIPV